MLDVKSNSKSPLHKSEKFLLNLLSRLSLASTRKSFNAIFEIIINLVCRKHVDDSLLHRTHDICTDDNDIKFTD